jgi:hypothetical protein
MSKAKMIGDNRKIPRQAAINGRLRRTSGRDEGVVPRPTLDWHEGGKPNHGHGEKPEDRRARPPEVSPEVERQQEREQRDRQCQDAAVVDVFIAPLRLIRGHDPPRDQGREGGDRQVHEEDPPPAERVGQGTAEQRADGVAEAGRTEEQAAGEPGP